MSESGGSNRAGASEGFTRGGLGFLGGLVLSALALLAQAALIKAFKGGKSASPGTVDK